MEIHRFNKIFQLTSFSETPTMAKQASKACLSLFIVLSLLANYSVSEKSSDKSYAPAASEPENKSFSPESLPVLPDPDSSTIEAEAVDETLSPTYFSVPPSADIPEVETKSDETLSQENVSTLSNADEPTYLTNGEENLSQELTSPPSSNTDPTLEAIGDEIMNTSVSSPGVDNSVLDTREMDNFSQEITSDPPSMADPAAVIEKSTEDLSQENTTHPPPSLDVPVLETSDDGSGSFTQDNQFPVTDVDAPAPETKAEQDISIEDYSSGTPPNTESQNPENVPELNDYSSVPKTANPASSEESSFPESDPTIQMTPSDDNTFGLAPTSDHTILPSSYRAEDEPVEPYEYEEDSWNGSNRAVVGVLVGACVIGVGGFVYQKRRKDNVRAQYQSLAKKGGV